jgi:hypothetical protein
MSIIGTMTFADHVAVTQGSPIFGVKFVAVRDRSSLPSGRHSAVRSKRRQRADRYYENRTTA